MQFFSRWFVKGAVIVALALGITAGIFNARGVAYAQDVAPQHFTVQAGAGGPANADALMFAPQSLMVHRGDIVTWIQAGFHNIRFGSEPLPLILPVEANGATVPALNPAIPFPNPPSGSVYSGGDANSGLPGDVPAYTLVIDLEPGTYSYLCDIHAGMAATLTVVGDDVAIPGPTEVTLQGGAELGAAINAASFGTHFELTGSTPMMSVDGNLNVQTGTPGAVSLNAFFPAVGVIAAGETVTWTIPEGSFEPHTVAWPLSVFGTEISPIEVEGGPPVLAIGPGGIPNVENGGTVGAAGEFNTGFMLPGQSYTLTFAEPGVYNYICGLHAGMQGTIVVQ